MKFQLKIIDVLGQLTLIIINIIALFKDYIDYELFNIHPLFILGGWQLISNLLNYMLGREEVTNKIRRGYSKALLIDLLVWVPILIFKSHTIEGYIFLVAFAQLPFSAVMAFTYIYLTSKEVAYLYNNQHENINHRWMNL